MPLYEYECEACGARFEQIRKFSDPPVEVCPTCGERKVQKLVSSPAIQFKGSGWYINDYARKGATGTDSEKTSPKETETKTETKSAPSETVSATPSTTPSTKDS